MTQCNTQESAETVGHNSNSIPLSEEPSFQTMLTQTWIMITYFCSEVKVNKECTTHNKYYLRKCLILKT